MKTHGRYAVVAKPNHVSDKLVKQESYDDLEMAHMRAKALANETGMFHIVVDTEVHDFKEFSKQLIGIHEEMIKTMKECMTNGKSKEEGSI